MLVPMGVCFLTPKARPTATPGTGSRQRRQRTDRRRRGCCRVRGRCVTRDEFELLPASQQVRSLQIDEHLYIAGAPEPEPADFINHSCEPNCELSGNVILVAARDIAAGEEADLRLRHDRRQRLRRVRVRRAGSASCRGKVTGHDWMLPELQLRYRGSFSPYLRQAHRRAGQRRRRAPSLRPLTR